MHDTYESPLGTRYASKQMQQLFSADTRYQTWRKLWTELARAQHELGLPITAEQVAELEAHITDIDYEAEREKEKEIRHDVMAHIYAYGLVCPNAKGIIHLGATSCYVTDNADLIIYRDGLKSIRNSILTVIANLAAFADKYKALPTLGYTHLQPAQLVTVGKRACLWIQDLVMDLAEIDDVIRAIRFLGCRGTTGTEASFLSLFNGDLLYYDRSITLSVAVWTTMKSILFAKYKFFKRAVTNNVSTNICICYVIKRFLFRFVFLTFSK